MLEICARGNYKSGGCYYEISDQLKFAKQNTVHWTKQDLVKLCKPGMQRRTGSVGLTDFSMQLSYSINGMLTNKNIASTGLWRQFFGSQTYKPSTEHFLCDSDGEIVLYVKTDTRQIQDRRIGITEQKKQRLRELCFDLEPE